MKKNFINSLIRYLIEKEYYNLIGADSMSLDLDNGHISLIREFQGTSVLLQIIDADRYSCEQITRIMENGAVMLNNIQGTNASVFNLFIFDASPEQEKIRILEQGQMDIISERKFLKCMSINIMNKQVSKHFSVPAFDAKLIKSISRFFSKDLYNRETTTEDILNLIEQRKKDFDIQLKAKKPWLTYGLIAVNIIVWAVLKLMSMKNGVSYDSLLEPFGAKVNRLILEGEYWRFITPMFLHGDEVHLAVNCYSLYIVGSQVEKLYGHGKFTAIYFISGFLGCVASFAFSTNASVGASGAIFGLLGAMLYFALMRPSLLKSSFGANLITTLVINLAYGYMNTRIDNHGHLGGLIGGFLTTGAVYSAKDETQKDKLKKFVFLVLVVAVSIGGLSYGFNNKQNLIASKLAILENYDVQQNPTETEKLGEEIIAMDPADDSARLSVLWSLAWSEYFQQKFNESIEHSNQLIQVSPVNGRYILGINYFETGEYEKAKQELLAAKELGSPNQEAIDMLINRIDNRFEN